MTLTCMFSEFLIMPFLEPARRIREGRGQIAPARLREGWEDPIPREGRKNPIPREGGNPISEAGGAG